MTTKTLDWDKVGETARFLATKLSLKIRKAESRNGVLKILNEFDVQNDKMIDNNGLFSVMGEAGRLLRTEISSVRDCYKRHNRHGTLGVYH